ncbi:hypothetical protein SpiGrapes_0146 [Sphaerochaeta pleomorpha str. Grapes]|uniref:Flavinylation-associated cytochrome domain-containing protein n=1 Tax=Sphaerochaeta pleomorpha (strain ATCC BAA-1885 / DSM 22778 / Grapes) TaxID=158190 RepID=G8QTP5_SPHPG|nr:DUF4405 domain-containing protein [Sphaerochaeta pleomorpha]AEV28010.1 hypothetical protein SpiGrapes_0146 [Sphaerochaeta pleomorpha str. Grapes]
MNHKTTYKLVFDAVMALLLVLMYNKNAVSMEFHELAGLVLLGIFLIHIFFNYRYFFHCTQRIFGKSLPVKTKAGYVLSLFSCIGIILMAISSVMISKTLFNIHGSNIWKTVHLSTAAALLIILGIHVGMHYQMIKKVVTKHLGNHRKIQKTLAVALTIGMLSFGLYNLATTQYLRWVSMPFSNSGLQELSHKEDRTEPRDPNLLQQTGISPLYTVLQYASILFVFVFLTKETEKTIMKRKRNT